MSQVFFVGSYTNADFGTYRAIGKGIYTCTLKAATGAMGILHCFEDIANPTYLALDKAKTHLYAVHETGKADHPSVSAFAVNDDFSLKRLNTQGMTGEGPCHLALDPTENFLAVANYSSGNVSLYPVTGDGSLGAEADSVQHEGKSVHPTRQEGPHAHATVFGPEGFGPDGETLFVADLGLDEIKMYRLNAQTAKLEPFGSVPTPPGAGPRHLVFHPSGAYVFVLNELASSLSVFGYTEGRLELLNTVSSLPADFREETTGAALRIHPSGRFVYASNRGHDSLAVFAFDEAQQSLKLVQHVSTGGKIPRDFALDPTADLLIAANQQTNTLLSYRLNADTGRLEPTGQTLTVETPVCIAML